MYLTKKEIQAFIQLVEEYDRIIIHRHVRPDPDAIGSQLGLKKILEATYPEKSILAAGTTSKGLAWLGPMDSVKQADYQEALVIVCDTANQDRIDGKHFAAGRQLIKIDHHPKVEDLGDLQIIYPEASSTSEIITLIASSLKDRMIMTDEAAKLLYAGIVGDTGRFMFASTSPVTFEMAAWLTTFDFSNFEINDRFQTLTLAQAKFQAFVFDNLEMNQDGVAWLEISIADRESYGISEEETNAFVNLPSLIEGNLAWVLFVEQEGDDGLWRCRIRSKGPVINEIASRHGGGGHPMASGANAYSEEERLEIVSQLSEVSRAYQNQDA